MRFIKKLVPMCVILSLLVILLLAMKDNTHYEAANAANPVSTYITPSIEVSESEVDFVYRVYFDYAASLLKGACVNGPDVCKIYSFRYGPVFIGKIKPID